MQVARYSLQIKGIVQGVGFRPYVYRLARSLSLGGFVKNTSEGVYAEIEGDADACDRFVNELKQHPPALSQIKNVRINRLEPRGDRNFIIVASSPGTRNTLISPDIGICDECAAEIFDKNNRRYRYAFTNCTNCGPRFTIIRDIPYDRSNTTMAWFIQCPDCRSEYEDPNDRRFHAQPNACPVCGPRLYFYLKKEPQQEGLQPHEPEGKTQPEGLKQGEPQGKVLRQEDLLQDRLQESGRPKDLQFGLKWEELKQDPFDLFDEYIKEGKIVAVKGLGGYLLVCDAQNEEVVARLRKNKVRYDKPFAVMMRDIDTVKRFCHVNTEEESLLLSARKPILLLKKKEDCQIAEETAPRNRRLGVMLPYTPLHMLLMEHHDVLVMTSANISDRPMIYDDKEAFDSLIVLADAVLTHDRPIFRRVDDSVCMVVSGMTQIIRRARGYAPEPVALKGNSRVILALGAQQKNTFCLAKGEDAFLSGHIGDLDDMDTEKYYESEIGSFIRLFDAEPDMIACDMHPDYVSTRYAARFRDRLPIYQIQHHHAHFASALAEHELEEKAIGLIFDGTGYGKDGAIWGGEALWGDVGASERIGHLMYVPLLGGEAAIREPWRIAMAMMRISCSESAALDFFEEYAEKARLLFIASDRGINSPMTSSMGRLFDAVAALAGIRTQTTFDGQAAIDLEHAMDESEGGSYGLDIDCKSGMMIFDWRQLISDVVSDVRKGCSAGRISAKFHRAVVKLLLDAAVIAGKKYGSRNIVLSGGVFQNAYLLEHGISELERWGFKVYVNEKVPANDGGISYGQAAAASRLVAQ